MHLDLFVGEMEAVSTKAALGLASRIGEDEAPPVTTIERDPRALWLGKPVGDRKHPRLDSLPFRNGFLRLLQARLGLRAREVIAIELDDIDWRAGELLVRGKGGLHDRLPLPKDVGEAITNYIRRDRKSASRTLFVTDRAPHGPFVDAQILNEVLEMAFRKAGVKPPDRAIAGHRRK
jgi:integrase